MTELLLLCYILMTAFSYYAFHRDLTAPAFIFCGVYMFSIIMVLVNKDEWQVDISDETFWVFFCGGIFFILLGLFFSWLWNPRIREKEGVQLSFIQLPNWLILCIVAFALIVGYMQYHAMMSIAGMLGAGTGSSSLAVAAVRHMTSYGTELSMPGYLVQLDKIVYIFSYILLFIYINNSICKAQEWKKIQYILPVLVWILSNIMTGNRLVALNIAGASFIYYYMLSFLRYANKLNSVKILYKLIISFVFLMIGFYSVRLLAGRVGSEQSTILQYISFYAGGPIKLFDMFLQQPVISDLWGKETFIPIHHTLISLGLENHPVYIAHKEFRDVNGVNVGNVYTAYRAWYADFGFEGIAILGTGVALFYNAFYYKLKSINLYQHKFIFIIYGFMSSGLFLHSIDDAFYKYFVSLGFVSTIVLFYFCYRLIFMNIAKYKIVHDPTLH